MHYISNHEIHPTALEDYWKFFTTPEGADILPYAYLESSYLYDSLVRDCEDYYLFSDEVKLIQYNKKALSHYLSDVINLIEIGPGSCYTIEHKTIPLLNYVSNLQNYYAVDHSKNYLLDACRFIESHIKGIGVYAVEANLMQSAPIQISETIIGKKAIVMLGSTLGNFTDQEQGHIVKQMSDLIDKGEIFIITADTNHDEKLLIKAYNNRYNYNLLDASLKYFSRISTNFINYIELFEPQCIWNKELKYIDGYFLAKQKATFHYPIVGTIIIEKGQQLRGFKSRKFYKREVINLLKENNLHLQDIITYSNKMQMFICYKE